MGVKVNVDTGDTIQRKLPNGLFPTEPIFVARPGAVDEDDGVVVMSGIDGGKEKGYVIIYNAKNMDVLFHATAPRKTLFGVHSKFYSFTDGCSEPDGDCTPEERGTTPSTTSTKPSPSPTSSATPSPTSSTTSHPGTSSTTQATTSHPGTSSTTQANNENSAAPHATLSLLLLSASILVAKCRF